ncbi:MAG: carotenoid biosynthesis protein [Actinobacteria bacterium]|nr:carotenoid biosynthesis protein [Actinomycetota bacterium]
MEASEQVAERERVSITAIWKEMPRSHQLMVALVPLFILSVCVVHIIAWARHEAPLQVYWVAIAMLSMLAICIWHAVVVKGAGQAVAFFVICILIGWFCEFIGHNYGWFFGRYNYTDTLGPAIGGVPILISITWAFIVYSSFMLIDWLVGIKGEVRVRSWWGKTLWSALVAAATATLVCAWDLMVDPMAASGIWKTAGGQNPWWYWFHGGPYLKELHGEGAMGMPGIPIGNFVGWWVAPFFMVLIFMLFFQRRNRVSGTLLDIVPLMVYFYIFFIVVVIVLEMNWYYDGMTQIALIGFFTMMPVILVSAVKLARDYT